MLFGQVGAQNLRRFAQVEQLRDDVATDSVLGLWLPAACRVRAAPFLGSRTQRTIPAP